MSWLDRLFGENHEPPIVEHKPAQDGPPPAVASPAELERVGLNGEYDQSGLAKRVAKAFDEAGLSDHKTLWIAQTGTTVVLKGKCANQDLLNKMVETAKGVSGAKAVETDQVQIG